MKAIIMAGGEGSRLRPLTCDCPKPMLPLMGRPLMEYAIGLLKRHGVVEIGVTLGYLPDAIMDYFGDGEDLGVHLHYFIEKTPLGTAGSVKQAQDFLSERFIVLSGDGIADFDLSDALDFHQQNHALATLILQQCSNPQEYGMVVCDEAGRIRSFHEKPGSHDVFSDRINTGIYILEPELLAHIPDGTAVDFGHDLFPALLAENAALFAHTAQGYWCDVGDAPAFLQVHMDAMDGKIHLDGLWDKAGISADGAMVESGCRLESPCFIGKNAFVAAGAHIGPYTVIGENCRIGEGVSAKRSVLFDGVQVDAGAQLRACIAGKKAEIGENAQLFEGSIVGSRSRVGARATLPPSVKLWPDKRLPDGERPERNVVWGQCRKLRFIGGAMELENPLQAATAAQACVCEMKASEIVLGRSSGAASEAFWHTAVAGAMAQGTRVIDAGVCSLPQLRQCMRSLHADGGLFVAEKSLLPLDASASILLEKKQRAILKLCERQDFSTASGGIVRPMRSAGETDLAYIARTTAAFRANPLLIPRIVLYAQGNHLRMLAEQCFERAGLQLRSEWDVRNMQLSTGEIGVYLAEDGQSASYADANGRVSDAQRQLLIAWTALQLGEKRLLLHNSASRAIERLAADYAAQAVYFNGEYALWMQNLAREAPLQFDLHFDGVYSTLCCMSVLAENELSFTQWSALTPQVFRKTAKLSVPSAEWGRLLHIIAEEAGDAELGGGVRLQRENAWAWLSPDEQLSGLSIMSEAMSMEAAESLCDDLERHIRRLMQK